jgi:hypothetical protein
MQAYELHDQLRRLGAIADMLIATDLVAVKQGLSHMDTVAPFFEPALFARGSGRIARIRTLVDKAAAFQIECARFRQAEKSDEDRRELPPASNAEAADGLS